MKALITADWHLASNSRDDYRWFFVEKTLPRLLKTQDIDLLLFLGDLTEAKGAHDAELVNRTVLAFKQLQEICPIVCLQGNHDAFTVTQPFFGFLQELSGKGENPIYWVSAPTPLGSLKNLPTSSPRTPGTLLLPFTHQPERDWGDINFRQYPWVFAHQCFAGASSESGKKLSGVSLSYFPKDTQVIAGDIHNPQTLGQLIYVGSPYHVDFGETFEPRCLLWNGKRLESILIDGPQKQLVEASSLKELGKKKPTAGDIVKVRLEVESYDAWPAAKLAIEEWADRNQVELCLAQPILKSPTKTSAKTFKEREALTDEELLRAYAKKRDVNDAYVKAGEKLL